MQSKQKPQKSRKLKALISTVAALGVWCAYFHYANEITPANPMLILSVAGILFIMFWVWMLDRKRYLKSAEIYVATGLPFSGNAFANIKFAIFFSLILPVILFDSALYLSLHCCGRVETYHAVVHKKDASSDGYHRLYAESERYGLEEFDSRRLYKRLPDQARIRIRKHISPLGTVVHYGDIEETPQPKVSDDLLL